MKKTSLIIITIMVLSVLAIPVNAQISDNPVDEDGYSPNALQQGYHENLFTRWVGSVYNSDRSSPGMFVLSNALTFMTPTTIAYNIDTVNLQLSDKNDELAFMTSGDAFRFNNAVRVNKALEAKSLNINRGLIMTDSNGVTIDLGRVGRLNEPRDGESTD